MSIVLLGTAGVAVLNAVAASARGATTHRTIADTQAAVIAGADTLMGFRPVVCSSAVATYQAQAQTRVATLGLAGWDGSSVKVVTVQEWDAAARAFKSATAGAPTSGCVVTNPDLITPQLVTLAITSPDGRSTRTIQVVTSAINGTTPISNPFSWNSTQFDVIAEGDVSIASTQVYAGLAVGGDLRWTSSGPLAGNSYGDFVFNGVKVTLVVQGRARFDQSTGTLQLNKGNAVIGDTSNGKQFLPGGANCWVPTAATTCTDPRISLQDSGTVTNAKPIDFAAAFIAYRKTSTALAALGTCTDAAAATLLDQNGTGPYLWSGNYVLRLTANKINYLNLTVAQLQQLAAGNANGSNPISKTSPLVINVTDAGPIAFTPPTFFQAAGATYVVWNFPNVTTSTIALNGPLWGSMMAPSAAVTMTSDVRGVVVAKSFQGTSNVVDWTYKPDITTTCARAS